MAATLTTDLAQKYDWIAEQGELVHLQIPVLDSAGNPYTVNGWSVDARIEKYAGGPVLYSWSSGDITVSGSNVTLTILPATSLAWDFRRGWWRCRIAHPSDATQIYRIAQGRFMLSPD